MGKGGKKNQESDPNVVVRLGRLYGKHKATCEGKKERGLEEWVPWATERSDEVTLRGLEASKHHPTDILI